jgi:hypothetical protein
MIDYMMVITDGLIGLGLAKSPTMLKHTLPVATFDLGKAVWGS